METARDVCLESGKARHCESCRAVGRNMLELTKFERLPKLYLIQNTSLLLSYRYAYLQLDLGTEVAPKFTEFTFDI